MLGALLSLGDRFLGLVVPRTTASACWCFTRNCVMTDGTPSIQECCKTGGRLYCEPCGG